MNDATSPTPIQPPMDEAKLRVGQVMQFLAELARRKSPLVRRWTDFDWSLDLSTLPKHPSVSLGPIESDDPSVILRVRRPKETPCEPPPEIIAEWVIPGWAAAEGEAQVLQAKNVREGEVTRSVAFDDDPARVKSFDVWKAKREQWVRAELPVRRVTALFQRLFELRGRLERESERFALHAGGGILCIKHDGGDIEQVLLMQRLELRFDSKIPRFELCQTAEPIELNTPLLRELSVQGTVLGELRERLRQSEFGLLSAEAGDFVAESMHRLFKDGQFLTSRPQRPPEQPSAFMQNVIVLAPRTGGIVTAIEAFLEKLKGDAPVPGPLSSIVLGDGSDEDLSQPVNATTPGETPISESGTWETNQANSSVDLLLAKPANPEQEAVVRTLAKRGQVVVQGPPGTGKSHTIANLIGHLLAEGKSILVTSHTTKALRVLRSHIPEDLRPLCVSVLDKDGESQRLLETSVKGIIAGLTRSVHERTSEAVRSQKARSSLMVKLRDHEHQMKQAIRDEYDDIIVGGEGYAPSKAARMVHSGEATHNWLPGPLAASKLCSLSAEEVRELYRLGVAVSQSDVDEIAAGLPNREDVLPPDELKSLLTRLAEAQSKAADPIGEVWEPTADPQMEPLTRALEQSRSIAKTLRAAAGLHGECLDCGRLGGKRREPWDDLLQSVARLADSIDESGVTVITHQPIIHPQWPKPLALSWVQQILVTTQGRERVSWWRFLIRPHWMLLWATSRSQGKRPTERKAVESLRGLLEQHRLRDELVRRWTAQVGPVVGANFSQLGERPEDACRHLSSPIKEALAWHLTTWQPFETSLGSFGFQWATAKERVAARIEPLGELKRWAETLERVVIPALEARRHRLIAQTLLAQLRSIHARLSSPDAGTIGLRLAEAILATNTERYSKGFARFAELVGKRDAKARRDALIDRLRSSAPQWAKAVESRDPLHSGTKPPSDPTTAWLWRQLEQELDRRMATDANALQRRCSESKGRLQEETSRYVSARVWERQHARVKGTVRAALFTWLQTVQTRGYENGVRSQRLKTEARRLLNDAREAVPVWIMPLARVVESYDFSVAQFDVVIIDEASQCDMTGLVALGIAKSAIVVGDDKQVSPVAVGEDLAKMDALIDEHLEGLVNKHLFTGRMSMYNLANAGFGHAIRLVEHFRCVNDIIQFSNQLSYDGEIKPLRESSRVATRPFVASHRVAGGERTGHVNETEAIEVVSLIVSMLEQPEYERKTFGVITMHAEEQALLIDRLLRERISLSEYTQRNVLCGTPPQFQGDERDVIVLSFVDHAPDGPLYLRSCDPNADHTKRFNVAASRARDQLWVVHSLNPEVDLKEGDIRRKLIKHAEDPAATERQLQSEGNRVESEFERLVFRHLTDAGYRVQTQWSVGAFRIDMVVIGAEDRNIAVECDGDRYHPPESLDRDLDRQRILERLGWQFVRIRGSEFFRNPDATMTGLKAKLAEARIDPIGATTTADPTRTDTELRQRVVRRAEELRRQWAEAEAEETEDQDEPRSQGSTGTSTFAYVSHAGTTNGATPSDLDESCRVVEAVVREARNALSRSEILARAGISPGEWLPAIRKLVSAGLLLRQGTKRGARYVAPIPSSTEGDLFEPTAASN